MSPEETVAAELVLDPGQLSGKTRGVAYDDDKERRIPLKIASMNGDTTGVQALLEKRNLFKNDEKMSRKSRKILVAISYERTWDSLVPSDTHAREETLAAVDGQTPLSCAAEEGHKEVVRLLLQGGEDVNEKNTDYIKMAPIHKAARHGHAEIVDILLQAGADIEAVDVDRHTALTHAVWAGQVAVVDLMLGKYNPNVNPKGITGYTPLGLLVYRGVYEMAGRDAWKPVMKRLIQEGGDTEARAPRLGFTPLMRSVYNGRTDVAELLLECGADPNTRASDGYTPLFLAARMGNYRMAEVLLYHAARLDLLDRGGKTPLDEALMVDDEGLSNPLNTAVQDKLRVVKLFLSSRPQLLTHKDSEGRTSVGMDFAQGRLEMAKVLLDYPGSEGTQTDFGLPLLCFAAFDGLENAAQLLIERGGYLHGTDSRYGRNALSWAIFKRNRKVTELLLQTPGLDWDNTDLRGRAPLFISAIANDEKSFKTLRSRGSDVHRPDRFGLTPLFVAVQRGAIGIVRDILENHPLQQEPRDRFGRSLTWWMWATGNTNMRDLVIGYGMQVEDEGQQSKGQTYKHSYLNSIESPCEICTISVDAAGQSMELGSGGRKYRICQICHDFGASNMDFASGRGVSRK